MRADTMLKKCWRCHTGKPEIFENEPWPKQLCSDCRRIVAGALVPPGPFPTPAAWWQSKALVTCWRCCKGPVTPDDDLGLCEGCLAELHD